MKFLNQNTTLNIEVISGPDYENWCRIRLQVNSPEGKWTSPVDPCIMGDELCSLEGFLSSERRDFTKIEFTEPELSFQAEGEELIVRLRFGMCPPWDDPDDGQIFSFPNARESMAFGRSIPREEI